MIALHRLTIFSLLVLSIGCASDKTDSDNNLHNPSEISIEEPSAFWTLTSKDDFLAENPGKYLEFNMQTDYCASIDSHKLDPLSTPLITSFNGIFEGCGNETRSQPLTECFQVTVNGTNLGADQNVTRSSSEEETLKNVFGKTTDFVISRKAATRSFDSADTTVTMYVPLAIEITCPSVKTTEDLFPLCYYKDMVIKWNADKANENGVMVVVEWMGSMVFGAQHPNIHIRRTDVITDDCGIATLKNELFEDIPDTALVYITLLRGNIENLLIDDFSYKLVAESHVVLPIILIRNLKTGL